jgi:hypothetical protein
MFVFGSGDAFVTPYGGAYATNPSPMQLFALQETTIDISAGTKPMMGKQQFPLAVARTEGKITVKVKFGAEYEKIWNDVFFGSAGVNATGSEIGVARLSQTLTSHIATVTPPNSGVFARSMAVTSNTGVQMYEVPLTPVLGVSYTRVAGVYTFASAEPSPVYISYTYTATTGFSTTVSNAAMGNQPVLNFTVMNAQYVNLNSATNVLFQLPAVIATKMSQPYKYNDFAYCELDLEAFQDVNGHVLYINADE